MENTIFKTPSISRLTTAWKIAGTCHRAFSRALGFLRLSRKRMTPGLWPGRDLSLGRGWFWPAFLRPKMHAGTMEVDLFCSYKPNFLGLRRVIHGVKFWLESGLDCAVFEASHATQSWMTSNDTTRKWWWMYGKSPQQMPWNQFFFWGPMFDAHDL